MKRICIYVLFFCCMSMFGSAQKSTQDTLITQAIILNGDTLSMVYLPSIYVLEKKMFKNRREEVKYTKLRRDVLKVLPYARLAGNKFQELEKKLSYLSNENQKRALTKRTETEIREGFEGELRNLTISQGKILIKLIDRETGNTSYVLVKEFRGNLSAFFWQSLARVFGSNLKAEYDVMADKDIEDIIQSADAQDFIYKAQK